MDPRALATRDVSTQNATVVQRSPVSLPCRGDQRQRSYRNGAQRPHSRHVRDASTLHVAIIATRRARRTECERWRRRHTSDRSPHQPVARKYCWALPRDNVRPRLANPLAAHPNRSRRRAPCGRRREKQNDVHYGQKARDRTRNERRSRSLSDINEPGALGLHSSACITRHHAHMCSSQFNAQRRAHGRVIPKKCSINRRPQHRGSRSVRACAITWRGFDE
jgi:hypothetical protein